MNTMRIILCQADSVGTDAVTAAIAAVQQMLTLPIPVLRFTGLTDDFMPTVSREEPTIFILDSLAGVSPNAMLTVAQNIRTQRAREDRIDPIILLTESADLYSIAFEMRLLLFDYILKDEDPDGMRLKDSLVHAITYLRSFQHSLIFSSNHRSYQVDANTVLYIYRDGADRKIHIHTQNGDYIASGTLDDLNQKLGRSFFAPHRSCIVNLTHVIQVDYSTNIIAFDDGTTLNSLSRYRKHDLKNYMARYM